MNTAHVLYRLEGAVAVLTLNRPAAKNAFSPEMINLWQDCLITAKADDRVRVIILTGQG
ncbi:MAG: enoyl-CoA hydratase, partial [Desulfobacteraceae bacterium]